MNQLAPIALFVFRRSEHLRQSIESLLCCPEAARSPIFVFADGPRGPQDDAAVQATRRVAQDLLGARAVYHFNDVNLGLSQSIISGVTQLVNQFGRVIVLEDDLILNPEFLGFMNSALQKYADQPQVFQVSGHMFDVPELAKHSNAVFLPITTSWGWATWQRAWQHFDPVATGWQQLAGDAALRRRFNMRGCYDYVTMLERQMQGLRDSWAIRWYWTVFKAQGMTAFPPATLVSNSGQDGSGTHGSGRLRNFSQKSSMVAGTPIALPDQAKLNEREYQLVCRAVWKQNGGWLGRSASWLRRLSLR
jgi:hypothetical protein